MLPSLYRLDCGRICRWLPKDLVGYQGNRRLCYDMRMWKGEREKRDPGRLGHKRIPVSKWRQQREEESPTKHRRKKRDGERRRERLMVGLVPAAEARGPRFVYLSFGSALSSALSCSWRIFSYPDVRRELSASTAEVVEDVTARISGRQVVKIVARLSTNTINLPKSWIRDGPQNTAGMLAYCRFRFSVAGGSSSAAQQSQSRLASLVSRQTSPC